MVGICTCRYPVYSNCNSNCEFPGNKSGNSKPGEEFKNGMTPHP